MGDPVTMAVVGASVGAMMNKKDPLKGAMLGAVGGYGGAALMPTLGVGSTAAGAGSAGTYTGLGMAGTAAAPSAAAVPTVATMPGVASFVPGGVVPAIPPAAPGIFAPPAGGYQSLTAGMQQPLTYDQATATGMQRPYGTFESLLNHNIESSSMAPTFMEQLGSGASQVGQFAQQNPVLVGMAAQSAQQMMQQPQRRSQPPGLLRGNQMQVAAPQYQVGVPQVSLI